MFFHAGISLYSSHTRLRGGKSSASNAAFHKGEGEDNTAETRVAVTEDKAGDKDEAHEGIQLIPTPDVGYIMHDHRSFLLLCAFASGPRVVRSSAHGVLVLAGSRWPRNEPGSGARGD